MQQWMIFSAVAMLFNIVKILTVRLFCQSVDSRLLVLSGRIVSVIVLLPVLFMVNKALPVDAKFWITIFITAILTAFASVLFTEAVKKGRLCVVMSSQALVPVFAIFALFIMYSELPGIVSMVLISISMASVGYVLHESYLDDSSAGRKIFMYSSFSIIAAVIFGYCTILDRVAIARVAAGALAYSA
ncbi:MAG: EamA family transporter, partial [Phycisphaerae bacterium]|nr:EamA family transporter [Phycisphaerae bacterium]